MEPIIKLSGALPKGEGLNAFDAAELAEELITATVEGRSIRPKVAVLVYDVQKVDINREKNTVTAVLRVRRVQTVDTVEGRRATEKVLLDEYTERHGDMLPFDVKSLAATTFGDLPRTLDEVDEREERERDTMSPADELRRHLERVHGRQDAHLLTDGEAEERHTKDHDGELPGELDHDRSWIGWTRADIEAATATSDGDQPDGETAGRQSDADNDEFDGLPLHLLDDDADGEEPDGGPGDMNSVPAEDPHDAESDPDETDNVRPLFSAGGN